MGEYITMGDDNVKIGTCENLYYATLRQLQRCAAPERSEYLDPANGYRYRFPFPDERGRRLGDYDNYFRGVLFSIPKHVGIEIGHGKVFYRTDTGQRDERKGQQPPAVGFELPCIQSDDFPGKKYDWQHTASNTIFEVVQQKIVTDQVKTPGVTEIQVVVRCPYCEELCRLSYEEVEKLVGFVGQCPETFSDLQRQIVEIIAEGYSITGAVVYLQ